CSACCEGGVKNGPVRAASRASIVSLFNCTSRRRHRIFKCDWSSDVCSSDRSASARPTFSRRAGVRRSGWTICPSSHRRSEERRVGKECRTRWSPHHLKKKLRDTRYVILCLYRMRHYYDIRRTGSCIVNDFYRNDLNIFFSSRRRHTRFKCDWSSDVCSSD